MLFPQNDLVIFQRRTWTASCSHIRRHIRNTFHHTAETYLTEHRQFFGKVHHSGYGRGDNFCKLTEGFDIHFISFRCIGHGCLTQILGLMGWREIKKSSCCWCQVSIKLHQWSEKWINALQVQKKRKKLLTELIFWTFELGQTFNYFWSLASLTTPTSEVGGNCKKHLGNIMALLIRNT